MTSIFNEFEISKLPKDGAGIEDILEISNSLTGECGRKLPPKFRYYHILRDVVGIKNMNTLYSKRLNCIWSLHSGIFERSMKIT